MSETTIPDVQEALVIRPGDTLVLRVPSSVTMVQVAEYREMARTRLGDRVADVIVVNVDQIAVIRAEDCAP